jgi:predicted PurR-regulated permease PerM
MSFDPMDTQTIKRLATKDITGWLLATLVAVIAWIGSSLITRVDTLTESFNAYELKMENRITSVEQKLQIISLKKE